MAQVSTQPDDVKPGEKSVSQEAADAPNQTLKEEGVSTEALKKLLGAAYGSNVELVEEKEESGPEPYVAKVRTTSYGTGTFVIDGRGATADAARVDLWNRVPRYKGAADPDVLAVPHDYSKPNGV